MGVLRNGPTDHLEKKIVADTSILFNLDSPKDAPIQKVPKTFVDRDSWKVRGSNPGEWRDSPHPSRPALEPTQPPI